MLPKELINIILEYYGKIKYRKGEYVDTIHKHDYRYDIIKLIIGKKINILKTIDSRSTNNSFYFEFGFDSDERVGLCYDYNFSFQNKFEICYYDIRNGGWKQIRTYI